MRAKFVRTYNVGLFMDAIERVKGRFVAEHAICLVAGDAGFGKSRAALWWALQHQAALISVSPMATPGWLLRDLVRELGGAPRRTVEDVKLQATGLLAADPRPIVVDEVENALDRGAAALDGLRTIADTCEVPLVLVGRERTPEKLQHYKQIWRRIGGRAIFRAISLADVAKLAAELAEAAIEDEVIEAIHANAEGRISQALAGIAHAERVAIKAGRPATIADFDMTDFAHPCARRGVESIAAARRRRRPVEVTDHAADGAAS